MSAHTHVTSHILLWLRLLYFVYKHELVVRDLQVNSSSEAGISTGYKHDDGMNANLVIKVPPDRREIFAAVATTTISPKFRVDCGKAIRVVIHTNATVLW